MKRISLFALLLCITFLPVAAQDNAPAKKTSFSFGGDLVSSYIWRGAYTTGASLQPSMALKNGGFTLAAWGSVDLASTGYKEVDFTASYSLKGFTLALSDYWWAGEGALGYFKYQNATTDHLFEGTLGYVLPFEKFPLDIRWNTIFTGDDARNADGDRCYSTYVEAAYPFHADPADVAFSVGVTPWEGLYADDFSVVSVGLKASKVLPLTDNLSMPVFGQIIANPDREDIFFLFGIGITIN